MITTADLKCTDKILKDLAYAKDFKTHSVLFTKSGQVIGLGEIFSYIKIEASEYTSHLRSIILETKAFSKIITEVSDKELDSTIFFESSNPTVLNTTKDIQLGVGLSPEYVTYGINNILQDITFNTTCVYSKKLNPKEGFSVQLRALRADEGIIQYPIHTQDYGDWLIPFNKKILPMLTTDHITINLLIHKDNPKWAYIEVLTDTKSGYHFMTYLKILKV